MRADPAGALGPKEAAVRITREASGAYQADLYAAEETELSDTELEQAFRMVSVSRQTCGIPAGRDDGRTDWAFDCGILYGDRNGVRLPGRRNRGWRRGIRSAACLRHRGIDGQYFSCQLYYPVGGGGKIIQAGGDASAACTPDGSDRRKDPGDSGIHFLCAGAVCGLPADFRRGVQQIRRHARTGAMAAGRGTDGGCELGGRHDRDYGGLAVSGMPDTGGDRRHFRRRLFQHG